MFKNFVGHFRHYKHFRTKWGEKMHFTKKTHDGEMDHIFDI